jgi:hypothetical protein
MMKTTHGRLLKINREPIFHGFITIATSDKGFGVLKPDDYETAEVPLHEPLIIEEPDADRLVRIDRVEGSPRIACFNRV